MAPLSLPLADESATAALAARLAPLLRRGDAVALHGTLGAGKTSFARGLIRAMAGDAEAEVPSPTFTLVQTYDTPAGTVWHFDLYRLQLAEEVWELGWEEARAEGIAVIEWPERLGGLLPADRLDIALAFAAEGPRRAELTGHGGWAARLAALGAPEP